MKDLISNSQVEVLKEFQKWRPDKTIDMQEMYMTLQSAIKLCEAYLGVGEGLILSKEEMKEIIAKEGVIVTIRNEQYYGEVNTESAANAIHQECKLRLIRNMPTKVEIAETIMKLKDEGIVLFYVDALTIAQAIHSLWEDKL